jgi:hypothetical protein
MHDSHEQAMSRARAFSSGRDSVTARRIAVAIAVSLVLHALALWRWKPDLDFSPEKTEERDAHGPLIVRIVPPPAAPRPRGPAPAAKPQPEPPRRTVQPREAPAPRPPVRSLPGPPVVAAEKPAPRAAPPVPPAPAPAPAARPPTTGDLLAYVEQQRRARRDLAAPTQPSEGTSGTPALEDENARANRIAAANLGSGNKPVMGGERRRGGGVFELMRMSYDYAEFGFYGWNKDMRRNTAQIIEVRKGNNPDIRLAVVRRIIVVIREHEQGDFTWESQRLGRVVTLSARARDNAGLEDFMMKEFFH